MAYRAFFISKRGEQDSFSLVGRKRKVKSNSRQIQQLQPEERVRIGGYAAENGPTWAAHHFLRFGIEQYLRQQHAD